MQKKPTIKPKVQQKKPVQNIKTLKNVESTNPMEEQKEQSYLVKKPTAEQQQKYKEKMNPKKPRMSGKNGIQIGGVQLNNQKNSVLNQNSDWRCKICTYMNGKDLTECHMCQSKKGETKQMARQRQKQQMGMN